MSAVGTGRGVHVKRGTINSSTTTAAVANPETDSGVATIYVLYAQMWVTVAGTTSTIVLQSHGSSAVFGVGDTTKVGVAIDINVTADSDDVYGIPLPAGEGIDIVTTGTPPTLFYELIYRVA